jgi:glycosyltransferase involved in cell wall biosynthesis
MAMGETMNIEAMVISVNEPQLGRCLESVKKQTVPFSGLTHVNNVFPECEAFNKGLSQVSGEWCMHIAGDVVLYEDTLEKVIEYIKTRHTDTIGAFFFGAHDTFLDTVIGWVGVLQTKAYKSVPIWDKLSNDTIINNRLRKRGWRMKKDSTVVIGTHFDDPDDFQIFRRFYTQEIKYGRGDNSGLRMILTNLLDKTEDPRYSLAIEAGEFAKKKRSYPGSHDLNFDRELFEEFRRDN